MAQETSVQTQWQQAHERASELRRDTAKVIAETQMPVNQDRKARRELERRWEKCKRRAAALVRDLEPLERAAGLDEEDAKQLAADLNFARRLVEMGGSHLLRV